MSKRIRLWLQGFALVLHFKKWDTRCWWLLASLTCQEGKATCTCILLKYSSSPLLWDAHHFYTLTEAVRKHGKNSSGGGRKQQARLSLVLPHCSLSSMGVVLLLQQILAVDANILFFLFFLCYMKLLNLPRDFEAMDLL